MQSLEDKRWLHAFGAICASARMSPDGATFQNFVSCFSAVHKNAVENVRLKCQTHLPRPSARWRRNNSISDRHRTNMMDFRLFSAGADRRAWSNRLSSTSRHCRPITGHMSNEKLMESLLRIRYYCNPVLLLHYCRCPASVRSAAWWR